MKVVVSGAPGARLGWLVGMLLAAGCAARAAAPPETPAAGALVDEAGDLVVQSALAVAGALAELEDYRVDPKLERGFLAPGARALIPVTLEPLTCTAIVAVATPSVADLDAALYTPDGSVLAEDDASDPRPVVRICTGKQRLSAYLALYAFQGTGSYAAARLSRARKESDPLQAAADDASGSPEFVELVRALHNRGYQDEGPSTRLPLVSGSSLRLAAKVVAGQCYSMVADGQALRLRLLDDDGFEVAQGVGEKGPAALQYCASRNGEFALELSAHGTVAVAQLARLRAAQAAVGGARAAWLGEPGPAADEQEPPVGQAGAPAQCTGAQKSLAKQVELSQGHVLELPLPRSGQCERLTAQLYPGLTRVTLRVESGQGEVLASREIRGEQGAVRLCGAPAARVTLIARAGFGAVSVTRQPCP